MSRSVRFTFLQNLTGFFSSLFFAITLLGDSFDNYTMHRSLFFGARSYPTSASAEAQIKIESFLWDQRAETQSDWKFGLVQARATVASHGMLDFAVLIYPISILEIGYSNSNTFRFYETKPFDCDLVACQGQLNRSSVFAKLLLGHRFQRVDAFVIPTITVTDVQHSGSGSEKLVAVDEVERLPFDENGDQLVIKSVIGGLKHGDWTYAIFSRSAVYKSSQSANEMNYLILRKEIEKFRVQGGLGQVASDVQKRDISFVFSVGWNLDEKSASLF